MNVELFEGNSGSAQKMRYFRKNKGDQGPSPGSVQPSPILLPPVFVPYCTTTSDSRKFRCRIDFHWFG